MGKEIISYTHSEEKTVYPEAAAIFSQVDVNPVHRGKFNELLPVNTVSGLYTISLVNEAIWIDTILCATRLDIQWIKPVILCDTLRIDYVSRTTGRTRVVHFMVSKINKKEETVAKGTIVQIVEETK